MVNISDASLAVSVPKNYSTLWGGVPRKCSASTTTAAAMLGASRGKPRVLKSPSVVAILRARVRGALWGVEMNRCVPFTVYVNLLWFCRNGWCIIYGYSVLTIRHRIE